MGRCARLLFLASGTGYLETSMARFRLRVTTWTTRRSFSKLNEGAAVELCDGVLRQAHTVAEATFHVYRPLPECHRLCQCLPRTSARRCWRGCTPRFPPPLNSTISQHRFEHLTRIFALTSGSPGPCTERRVRRLHLSFHDLRQIWRAFSFLRAMWGYLVLR